MNLQNIVTTLIVQKDIFKEHIIMSHYIAIQSLQGVNIHFIYFSIIKSDIYLEIQLLNSLNLKVTAVVSIQTELIICIMPNTTMYFLLL